MIKVTRYILGNFLSGKAGVVQSEIYEKQGYVTEHTYNNEIKTVTFRYSPCQVYHLSKMAGKECP